MTRPTPQQRGQAEQEPAGASGSPSAAPPPQVSPPAPAQQSPAGSAAGGSGGGVTYTKADLEEASAALGCHSWDVAGIFFAKHAQRMTMPEFEAALKEWRTPKQRPPQAARQQRGVR